MIHLLLYTTLSCPDAAEVIQRARQNEDLSNVIKKEIIVTIKEATPECKWDAHD